MKKIKILELFAGAGGSSTGLSQVDGVEVVVANEFDKYACDTYEHNNNHILIRGDITEPDIKKEIIKQAIENNVNVLVGGIPCQSFSNAGNRDPFDIRGQLYKDYFDVLDAIKPDVCVIENVKGVISIYHFDDNIDDSIKKEIKEDIKKKTKNEKIKKKYKKYMFKVIDKWVEMFKNRKYNVEYRILKASNYGVPQHRERMIMIASKLTNNKIIFPTKTHNEKGDNNMKKWVSVRDAIDDLKNIEENKEINHTFRKYKSHKLMQIKIRDTPFNKSYTGYGEANKKCHPDFPCSTVKENHGAVFLHYEKPRHMTVRELARLQTFPDDIIFKCKKGQAFKQIGNAVPCILGKVIGMSIKKMFELNQDEKITITKQDLIQMKQELKEEIMEEIMENLLKIIKKEKVIIEEI
jgi:DNA (cytosine-5)-methyltransferase 1